MIGNDIIDIAYTRKNSDWTRRGFLEKVFTADEQTCIATSIDPFTAVWRLWSMKESAYKLHMRSTRERSFSPARIACRLLDDQYGLVTLGGVDYHTTTKCSEEYIFSFATPKDAYVPTHQIRKYGTTLPKNYYTDITQSLAAHLACGSTQLELKKNEIGIPHIYYAGSRHPSALSITHHGRFLAWSVGL